MAIFEQSKIDSDTHPSIFKRYQNSSDIVWSLSKKRTEDYLGKIYDGYVPEEDRPRRWVDLVEENSVVKADMQAEIASVAETRAVPVAADKKQTFLETAKQLCNRFDTFMNRITPGFIRDEDQRESFQQNAIGMTAGIVMAAGAVALTGPLSAGFLAGATMVLFCANKMDALKKKAIKSGNTAKPGSSLI